MPGSPSTLRNADPLTRLFSVAAAVALSLVALAGSIPVLWSLGEGGAVVLEVWLALVLVGAWRWLGHGDRAVLAILAVAYALRIGSIATMAWIGVTGGRGPFLTLDEYGYYDFATLFSYLLRSGTHPLAVYLADNAQANAFVNVQATLFLVFGDQAAIGKVVNAFLSVLAIVLAHDTLRRLFGRPAALAGAAMLAFFPTLVLWSVLNLREAWMLLLVVATIWSLERMRTSARTWVWLVAGIYVLTLLTGIRSSLYLVVGSLFPIAVYVALRDRAFRMRAGYSVLALVFGYGILMQVAGRGFFGVVLFDPATLTYLENERAHMATGARTAFAPDLAERRRELVLRPGVPVRLETVAPVSRTPAVSQSPPGSGQPTPSMIVVEPGQRVVIIREDQTPPPGPFVAARAGDVVVLGTPAPNVPTTSYVLPPLPFGRSTVVVAPRPLDGELAEQTFRVTTPHDERGFAQLGRILLTIPEGLPYVLFAPFPLFTRTGYELLFLPDTLAWVAALVAAATSAWRLRRRLANVFMPLALSGGMLVLLAIVEGNVGTLVRHRAMAIAPVLLLASPVVAEWATAVARRISPARLRS